MCLSLRQLTTGQRGEGKRGGEKEKEGEYKECNGKEGGEAERIDEGGESRRKRRGNREREEGKGDGQMWRWGREGKVSEAVIL